MNRVQPDQRVRRASVARPVCDAFRVCARDTSDLRVRWAEKPPRESVRSPLRESVMKAMKNLLVKLVKDEQGGEVLEYALIAGLIVVAAIAVIGAVGTKVLARWNSLNSGM